MEKFKILDSKIAIAIKNVGHDYDVDRVKLYPTSSAARSASGDPTSEVGEVCRVQSGQR